MTIKKLSKKLKKINNVLILMHKSPDIDALGSAYALLRFFLTKGKNAHIGIEEELSERMSFFISDEEKKEFFKEPSAVHGCQYDWVICVDTSDPFLLGRFQKVAAHHKGRVIVIDHHQTFNPYGEWNLNIPSASSTCELILDLFRGKVVDSETALALYAGMAYDTGNFRYSSTSPALHRKVAALLEQYPLNTENVFYRIYENESLARKKLIGKIVESIETYYKGEAVVSFFPFDFRKKLDLSKSDASGLVNVGHSLEGCRFSIFVKEKEDGIYFSFRTRTEFDVARLAQRWGGGGHKKASGLKMGEINLKTAREKIVPECINAYEKWRENND